jgi:hypothetical protein
VLPLVRPILTFLVAYILALVATTLVAVVFFGSYPDRAVVPLEYLIPLGPAVLAYRRFRTSRAISASGPRATNAECERIAARKSLEAELAARADQSDAVLMDRAEFRRMRDELQRRLGQ